MTPRKNSCSSSDPRFPEGGPCGRPFPANQGKDGPDRQPAEPPPTHVYPRHFKNGRKHVMKIYGTRESDQKNAVQAICLYSVLCVLGGIRVLCNGNGNLVCCPDCIGCALPARGATPALYGVRSRDGISIHAPCTRSDLNVTAHRGCFPYFNPRSPCGERLLEHCHEFRQVVISIRTLRTGSNHHALIAAGEVIQISIPAPRVESDQGPGG